MRASYVIKCCHHFESAYTFWLHEGGHCLAPWGKIRSMNAWFVKVIVEELVWPTQSLDPEHVWDEIEPKIQAKSSCLSSELDLFNALVAEWANLHSHSKIYWKVFIEEWRTRDRTISFLYIYTNMAVKGGLSGHSKCNFGNCLHNTYCTSKNLSFKRQFFFIYGNLGFRICHNSVYCIHILCIPSVMLGLAHFFCMFYVHFDK